MNLWPHQPQIRIMSLSHFSSKYPSSKIRQVLVRGDRIYVLFVQTLVNGEGKEPIEKRLVLISNWKSGSYSVQNLTFIISKNCPYWVLRPDYNHSDKVQIVYRSTKVGQLNILGFLTLEPPTFRFAPEQVDTKSVDNMSIRFEAVLNGPEGKLNSEMSEVIKFQVFKNFDQGMFFYIRKKTYQYRGGVQDYPTSTTSIRGNVASYSVEIKEVNKVNRKSKIREGSKKSICNLKKVHTKDGVTIRFSQYKPREETIYANSNRLNEKFKTVRFENIVNMGHNYNMLHGTDNELVIIRADSYPSTMLKTKDFDYFKSSHAFFEKRIVMYDTAQNQMKSYVASEDGYSLLASRQSLNRLKCAVLKRKYQTQEEMKKAGNYTSGEIIISPDYVTTNIRKHKHLFFEKIWLQNADIGFFDPNEYSYQSYEEKKPIQELKENNILVIAIDSSWSENKSSFPLVNFNLKYLLIDTQQTLNRNQSTSKIRFEDLQITNFNHEINLCSEEVKVLQENPDYFFVTSKCVEGIRSLFIFKMKNLSSSDRAIRAELLQRIPIPPYKTPKYCFYKNKLAFTGINDSKYLKTASISIIQFSEDYRETLFIYTVEITKFGNANTIQQFECNEMQNSVHVIISELTSDQKYKDPKLFTLSLNNFGKKYYQRVSPLYSLGLQKNYKMFFNSDIENSQFIMQDYTLESFATFFALQSGFVNMNLSQTGDVDNIKFKLYQSSSIGSEIKMGSYTLTVQMVDFELDINMELKDPEKKIDFVPKKGEDKNKPRVYPLNDYVSFKGPLLELIYIYADELMGKKEDLESQEKIRSVKLKTQKEIWTADKFQNLPDVFIHQRAYRISNDFPFFEDEQIRGVRSFYIDQGDGELWVKLQKDDYSNEFKRVRDNKHMTKTDSKITSFDENMKCIGTSNKEFFLKWQTSICWFEIAIGSGMQYFLYSFNGGAKEVKDYESQVNFIKRVKVVRPEEQSPSFLLFIQQKYEPQSLYMHKLFVDADTQPKSELINFSVERRLQPVKLHFPSKIVDFAILGKNSKPVLLVIEENFTGVRIRIPYFDESGHAKYYFRYNWIYTADNGDSFDPQNGLIHCDKFVYQKGKISYNTSETEQYYKFECALTSKHAVYSRIYQFKITYQTAGVMSFQFEQLAEFKNPYNFKVTKIQKYKEYLLVAGEKNISPVSKKYQEMLASNVMIQIFKSMSSKEKKAYKKKYLREPTQDEIQNQGLPWFVVDSSLLEEDLTLEELNPLLGSPETIFPAQIPKPLISQQSSKTNPAVLMITNIRKSKESQTDQEKYEKVILFYISGSNFKLEVKNYRRINVSTKVDMIRLKTYINEKSRFLSAYGFLYDSREEEKSSSRDSSGTKPLPKPSNNNHDSKNSIGMNRTELILWLTLLFILVSLAVGFFILLCKLMSQKYTAQQPEKYVQIEDENDTILTVSASASNKSLAL